MACSTTRVKAPFCGPGLEGHCREPARGSWDVAQWAGGGKTQLTRQDRASCGLDIFNEQHTLGEAAELLCHSMRDPDATVVASKTLVVQHVRMFS